MLAVVGLGFLVVVFGVVGVKIRGDGACVSRVSLCERGFDVSLVFVSLVTSSACVELER